MKEKLYAAAATGLLCATSLWAGFIDHGDYTGFPNVNVDAHLQRIVRLHVPELEEAMSQGMARRDAWDHDIRQAAKGLPVDGQALNAFITYVQDRPDDPRHAVRAPHPALLEFELYVRGCLEIPFGHRPLPYPAAWKELMSLPPQRRRYTTIPIAYLAWHICDDLPYEPILTFFRRLGRLKKEGFKDTQCCMRALFFNFLTVSDEFTSLNYRIDTMHKQLINYVLAHKPNKPWRHTNAMDLFLHADSRGDQFYSGTEMPDVRCMLYLDSLETLRKTCKADSLLRDLVVAVGLTNHQMENARIVAREFAAQSPVNTPLLALRLPPDQALKMLAGKPQYAQLRELIRIKSLSGMPKVQAIASYVRAFPDYTPEDMPKTSIALNTHLELNALAGAELLRLGKPVDALRCWLRGGTPEDIGLAAEQTLDTDQLLDFCRRHCTRRARWDFPIYSSQCARDNKLLYPVLIGPEEVVYLLRNILARRLMREKRYAEARPWFTGAQTRCASEQFFRLKALADNPKLPGVERLEATLSLAALTRFKGDVLCGTFLEPDDVICNGNFNCRWGLPLLKPAGMDQAASRKGRPDVDGAAGAAPRDQETPGKNLRLNKPRLPRFHYRWIAADYYRNAAGLADDPQLRGFCFWMAGTLLKVRDPKTADRDFKSLYAIQPSLTAENWFLPLAKAPAQIRQWHACPFFVFDDSRIGQFLPPMPQDETVPLPPHDGSPQNLLNLGLELAMSPQGHTPSKLKQAICALRLAAEKGSAEAWTWRGVLESSVLARHDTSVTFFRKALELDPTSNLARHELGRAYLKLGLWSQGIGLIGAVADSETQDRQLLGLAAYGMGRAYAEGAFGLPYDINRAGYYLKKARRAGSQLASDYLEQLMR